MKADRKLFNIFVSLKPKNIEIKSLKAYTENFWLYNIHKKPKKAAKKKEFFYFLKSKEKQMEEEKSIKHSENGLDLEKFYNTNNKKAHNNKIHDVEFTMTVIKIIENVAISNMEMKMKAIFVYCFIVFHMMRLGCFFICAHMFV